MLIYSILYFCDVSQRKENTILINDTKDKNINYETFYNVQIFIILFKNINNLNLIQYIYIFIYYFIY